MFDNCKLNVTPEFIQVEQERLQQAKALVPDYDEFPWVVLDFTVDCSLKHVAYNYLNYNVKWPELGNVSMFEWLETNILHNTKI